MQIKNGVQQIRCAKPQFATLVAERQLHSKISGAAKSFTAKSKFGLAVSATAVAATPAMPTVTTTNIVAQELSRNLRLPGELQPYQDVQLFPKVQGFISWIGVDCGSEVKARQVLVRLTALEFAAQRSEAEAKTTIPTAQKLEAESRIASIRAQRLEAEAKLAASTATYNRLKAASATPSVISGNARWRGSR